MPNGRFYIYIYVLDVLATHYHSFAKFQMQGFDKQIKVAHEELLNILN